jgi:glycosyltransferase involved in cell wall biosynthesis
MIKKICFFTTNFSSHAQERLSYAEKYFPKEIELFLITPPSQNKYNLKRTKIVEASEKKVKFIFFLRKFCKKNKINLLLNLGIFREAYASFWATSFTKTEFILNEHGNVISFQKLENNFLLKIKDRIEQAVTFFIYSFSKKVVFGAKDQAEELKDKLFFARKKICYLPLIIDEKTFNIKDKILLRKELNLPLKKNILIFVGRISYLKGSDIIYKLAEKNKDKLFILAGQEVDKIFSEKKLDNVLLVGSKKPEELSKYYSASDLSILPSRIEGFGLVSRESMLCGTPSLVSDITALKSIPQAIVSENDAENMQSKIDWFFSLSEDKRKVIGLNMRKAIVEETSYNNLKDSYIKTFLD